MVSQLYHNILIDIERLGFQITWKFISIGLYGYEEVSRQMSYEDLFEYLYTLSENEINKVGDKIGLLYASENDFELKDTLVDLAQNEQTEYSFELQKWRVYLLKKIIDDKNIDVLQGLLELMEFWLPIKDKVDCPHTFPETDGGPHSIFNYFTESMYIHLLKVNRIWVNKEIEKICEIEDKDV